MIEKGTAIRYGTITPRGIKGRGKIKKIYDNFILIDSGRYNITLNRADVIDRDLIIEVKQNKEWICLSKEMLGY